MAAATHWFDKMSRYAQMDYLRKHPNSIYKKRLKKAPTARQTAAANRRFDAQQKLVRDKKNLQIEKLRKLEEKFDDLADNRDYLHDMLEDARETGDADKISKANDAYDAAAFVCYKLNARIEKLHQKIYG